MSIRVLLADDQGLVRAGFRKLLETESDIEVVGEAEDGAGAAMAARRLNPDVVLMDIRMPRMDGIEAARRMAADVPRTRVVILTTYDLDEYVYQALRAGACGFLLKDAPPEQLISAVRLAASGDALLAPAITRRLIEEFARRPAPDPELTAKLVSLTERETEVLGLLSRGLGNAEIARQLNVGEATVKTHVANVLQKVEARDRVQAVVFAYESGVISPGSEPRTEQPFGQRA
jgi:DNA-binding NarL/FixJ family response regulator